MLVELDKEETILCQRQAVSRTFPFVQRLPMTKLGLPVCRKGSAFEGKAANRGSSLCIIMARLKRKGP